MKHDDLCPQPAPFGRVGNVIIPPVTEDGGCEMCNLITRVRVQEQDRTDYWRSKFYASEEKWRKAQPQADPEAMTHLRRALLESRREADALRAENIKMRKEVLRVVMAYEVDE